MEILNIALSIGGFVGWFWVWHFDKYKTGRSFRIQLGVILLGFMWVMLIMADLYQDFIPSWGTVGARIIIAIAFVCLMPLLKSPIATDKEATNGA